MDYKVPMKNLEASARSWLSQNGLRLTRGRIAIVGELLTAPAPLTLSELHTRLKVQKCDFATVFRFIRILEKKKLALRHAWNDRQPHYELGGLPHGHHHHHLICKSCRRVEEIEACTVTTLERELARQKGYSDVSHSLEFFGVCPDCQQESPSKTAPSGSGRKLIHKHRT